MFKNTFVYNTGRVISYTIIGGVLGDSRWMQSSTDFGRE